MIRYFVILELNLEEEDETRNRTLRLVKDQLIPPIAAQPPILQVATVRNGLSSRYSANYSDN